MTKEEFYNAAVDVYLKSGQALPGFITMKVGRKALNELVEEGKMKIIKQHYSYLPDDEWLCLTGVYCVEEEMAKGNHRPLDFIRKYLGTPRNSAIDRKIDEYLEKNPDERLKLDREYDKWLEENRDILEKSFQIKKIDVPEKSSPKKEDGESDIDDELKDYIRKQYWYKRNFTIQKILVNISSRIRLNDEMVRLLKISIQRSPSGSNTDKNRDNLEKSKYDLKMDKMVKQLLFKTNKTNKTIKEFFNF